MKRISKTSAIQDVAEEDREEDYETDRGIDVNEQQDAQDSQIHHVDLEDVDDDDEESKKDA